MARTTTGILVPMIRLTLLSAAILSTAGQSLVASPRASANYSLPADTIDAGGRRGTSTAYSHDGSLGGVFGIATGGAPSHAVKAGYTGQLTDGIGLQVIASPSTVNETETRQLSAFQMLDDQTSDALPATDVTWSVLNGPLTSITSAGLATGGTVYQNTAATAQGSHGGSTGVLFLTVLDTIPDNFGTYASDGLGDDWQVQYFGENNPLAAPLIDSDGDGINNLLEFVLNGNPVFSDSSILPAATLIGGQFIFNFSRREDSISGLNLVFQSSSNLQTWANVPISANAAAPVSFGPVVNGMQPVTVTLPMDPSATKLFARLKVDNSPPGGNLLQNGSGASPVTTGWTILANGGSGWNQLLTQGYDATPGHFRTSYGWCRRSQTIDLLAAGYTAQELDAQPRIRVGEAISSWMNNNIADSFYIKVELRDVNQNIIASWNRGTFAAPLQATTEWVLHQHDFTNYGPGVRYVYFEDGGKDNGNWAGPFGTYHDAASVEVLSN